MSHFVRKYAKNQSGGQVAPTRESITPLSNNGRRNAFGGSLRRISSFRRATNPIDVQLAPLSGTLYTAGCIFIRVLCGFFAYSFNSSQWGTTKSLIFMQIRAGYGVEEGEVQRSEDGATATEGLSFVRFFRNLLTFVI